MSNTESKLTTWTDTTYSLTQETWLYVVSSSEDGTTHLVCPGVPNGGNGFVIRFQPCHLSILESLITQLQQTHNS
ncbi:hypothetical protein PCC9214_05376 (plasmid) [Planktothrix tepida]|uniref:Uncharacterized protein n=1 Tax=Planktothrix tepida PCC 9214 TaxID=671072 RepID=A0A1J1LPS9_9CYAN|nr:hypothetical protein [Planktothrix tepida]CAD5988411.1 hypothetical protein PCC9214_05376 [Planktothrix tepida]CUR33924.1 conserved hypothetical protein [Planktothrix tepida PCC 9214]